MPKKNLTFLIITKIFFTMKKIFTLSLALVAALSASAQAKYGLYADTETLKDLKQICGPTELADGSYDFGYYQDENATVTKKNGMPLAYLDVKSKYPEVDRLTSHYNAGNFGGNFAYNAEVWGVFDDALVYSSSLDATDADPKAIWTKPNPDGGEDLEVNETWDLIGTAPDRWIGFAVDVAAGKELNVTGIAFNCASNQNFIWAIAIYDEAGNQKYFSGNAKMRNSNSTDESKAKWQDGISAYITTTDVREISGWVVRDNVEQPGTLASTSPAKAFAVLPEGGLKLTGKNTVRLYYACKNARLMAIERFWLETGSGDPSGIGNIEIENIQSSNAQTYNLAGQAVGAGYKGIVVKGNKKFIQR